MLGKSFGGSVKLSGESEYRKALRDITSSLKEVSSELKLTNIQFTNGEKTVKETKTSYDSANNTIKEQREKVNELRETLKQAEKQYGSNNEKVKLFKTQLNNAESQLASMEEQTDKSTKEIKEMKKGFDDAGSGALKFGDILKANVLSEAIVSGIKKLGSVVKEVGSAFIKIGKQALDSYADYEQLVGGVETLFKDNASTVENYANNAYKTAGLSANEYMETITAFSASLLQSLNGDTAKSAEVADMAITDMADNANKMGTSMDMIQNAYQGFAKQNYTMLDNLKLGYGGTKSEMERLLADAQKISGVKYDISNLNDVYQAIHVIQGELGITGTTAKEASTTIQGSVSAMKSAWQNMLTGLANGNADISGLLENLADSVLTVADNIMPVVEQVANSIMEILPEVLNRITENLPQFLSAGSNILTNIITGLTNNMPAIMNAIMQILNTLINTVVQNLPQIIDAGIQILTSLVQGIAESLPTIIPAMVDAVVLMVESLIDNIDLIIDAGIQLIIALAEGLIEALPKLIEKIPTIIEKLVTKLTNPEMIGKIIQAAARLIVELGIGLIKAIPQLLSKIPQIISTIVKGLMNGVRSLKDVGKNLLKGLWEGMSGLGTWLWNKVKGMLNGLTDKIKNFFGIHSPSTLFKDEIGENLALGLGEGFTDTMKNVTTDMQNAIPTEFDTSMEINSTKNIETNQNNNSYLVQALKEALKEMKVELNDREVGNFVDSKLAEAVY